jgi:hypothetical protein
MLTAGDFRRLALGLTGAVEGAHMGHPDFRANGRIFASLHADGRRGMVTLTPAQQQEFVERAPGAFTPESGAWGLQGCTRVQLDAVDEETLGEALTLAYQASALKAAPRRKASPRPPRARPKY